MKRYPVVSSPLIASLLASILATASVSAITSTWTGNGSVGVGNWSDLANWDNGIPGIEDTAIFDTAGKANMPYIGTAEQGIKQIHFNDSGWTISSGTGGYFRFRSSTVGFFNNAPGTNTIAVDSFLTNSSGDVFTWSAPTGTTLIIDGTSYKKGNSNTLLGGGTIYVNSENTDGVPGDTSGFSGLLLLGANGTYNIGNGTIAASATIGGIGTFETRQYGQGALAGTLAPGGDGVLLPLIGTVTLASENSNRSGIDLLAGSTVAMDIGIGGPGDNDKVQLDFNSTPSLDIESGVTLALFGTIVQDGTYTLVEDIGTSANIEGTFDTITFNGEDVTGDTSRFLVNYGNDTITITMTNVPEPSTYALILGVLTVGLVIYRRRS